MFNFNRGRYVRHVAATRPPLPVAVGPLAAVELTVEIDNQHLPLHCNLTSVRRPTRQSVAPASVSLCRGWTCQSEGSNGVQAEGRTRLRWVRVRSAVLFHRLGKPALLWECLFGGGTRWMKMRHCGLSPRNGKSPRSYDVSTANQERM